MSEIRITLTELQNPRKPGPKPGDKNYHPAADSKANRCPAWYCDRYVPADGGGYRFVDDRLVRLCDECLLKYDQKQDGR